MSTNVKMSHVITMLRVKIPLDHSFVVVLTTSEVMGLIVKVGICGVFYNYVKLNAIL